MSSKLGYFSDLIARVMIEIEYKKVIKKLKKYDLIADVDDQRSVSYTHLRAHET